MPRVRPILAVLMAVAARTMRALLRLAKRFGAPGAGPKLVAG